MTMHAPVRTAVSTTDPERARALLSAPFADTRLQVGVGTEDFRFEQTRLDLGAVRVDSLYSGMTAAYQMDPIGRVAVSRILQGNLAIRQGDRGRRFTSGDVLLVADPDRGCSTWADEIRLETVTVDLPLFAQVADHPAALVRRLSYDTLSPVRARNWRNSVDYLTRSPGSADESVNALILGAAGQLLAATILALFGDEPEPDPSDSRDATGGTMARAIAYMEANPDLDLAVADLARAARVSIRALQLAFRRHLDTTPMRYLRRVRLDLARADLTSAAPGAATVTDIAMRWGYADLSRFAADYRTASGEHPHTTLRRLGE